MELVLLPDSPEESTIAFLLQGVDRLVGESGTGAVEGVIAGIEIHEGELQVQRRGKRLQNPSTGLQVRYILD